MNSNNTYDQRRSHLSIPIDADLDRDSSAGFANTDTAETATESQTAPSANDDHDNRDTEANHLSFVFRDGLDMPIPDLELSVTLPSGLIFNATSTVQGAITVPVPPQAEGQAKVEVKDLTGNQQAICSVDLAQCNDAVIIRSPKVKANVKLRPHQQTVPPVATDKPASTTPAAQHQPAASKPPHVDATSPWWSTNGAVGHAWTWLKDSLHLSEQAPASVPKSAVVATTLNNAGQPVSVVAGPECPNPDKLKLGRNNIYRQPILDASKRLGLIPQSLCALIDCEAAKIVEHIPKLGPDGKQLTDKKGKPLTTEIREVWKADSGNGESSAAGITQFVKGTWMDHVMSPGYYIHEQSKLKGWVAKNPDAKGKIKWVFVLADGTTTTQPFSKHPNDGNVVKCLAMRMDPTWSINAAADYGNANLKILQALGFKLDGLNDMDKAKLMYLMHHEGGGGGPLFIRNKLASRKGGLVSLRSTFIGQLGSKNGSALAAQHIADADGDVELAYRKWLADYIDKKFVQSSKYFCSQAITPNLLTDVLPIIGGEKIHATI